MKKLNITICVLIVVGILFFLAKTEKDDYTLGDNYYYLTPYEAVDVGFLEGAIIYKSSQKNVFSDIKVHGEVTSMNYNKDFIIALQQKKNADPFEDKMSYYYIIVKKSDIVFGPFKKEEYLQKREEIGVPKKLQLKE